MAGEDAFFPDDPLERTVSGVPDARLKLFAGAVADVGEERKREFDDSVRAFPRD